MNRGINKNGSFKNTILRSDDVFLVSYPKSGSTWLRFLIGNYLSNCQCNFNNSHLLVPDIHFNPSRIKELEGPRFIKSHLPYTPQYLKVVYLVRDGRDVAVSYFFHCKKYNVIPASMKFTEFIELFNQGTIDNFGLWNDHVVGWHNNLSKDAILIRYENMKIDPLNCLKEIIDFSGINFNSFLGEKAVRASSLEAMKRQEQAEYSSSPCLQNSNINIRFVRNGETQEWKKFVFGKYLEDFNNIHGSALKRIGYI